MAFYRREDLRILGSNVAEFAHSTAVFVVYVDGFLDSEVRDLDAEDAFQFSANVFVFGFEEVDGRANLTVLGMSKYDDRSLAVPFLAHAAKSVAGTEKMTASRQS